MNKSKNTSSKSKIRTPIFAKKSFGQNFLVDQNYVDKIIAALAPNPGETIIEIGAGRGALTEKLIEAGADVIAIELERDMIIVLREKFANAKNFRLVESDALKVDFSEIVANRKSQIANQKPVKLVANLPYYISTAILQKLIAERAVFSEMILMFQREVVARIVAEVGDSERGFLTVLTEAYLMAEKLFDVPPAAFRPQPKVWSAVVRLAPRATIGIENDEMFRRIVSRAFGQKRKTILNNLKSQFADAEKVLQNCQIEPQRRAETLTIDEWKCLFSANKTANGARL